MKALLAAAALLATGSAHAAGKDVEDLLAKMRKAYGAFKNVTFVTESHFGPTTFINTFSFRSPDKIRLEITAPSTEIKGAVVKVTDGKKIFVTIPGQEKPVTLDYSLKNYEFNLPVSLESFAFFDPAMHLSTAAGRGLENSELKIVKDEGWAGKRWTVLEEATQDGKSTSRYFIDPKTFWIWRTTVKKGGVDYEDSRITKLDTDATIADSAFTLPKG